MEARIIWGRGEPVIAGLTRVLREPERHAVDLRFPEGTLFSVRSSATAEDLPYASFAGQQVSKNYKGVVIMNGKKLINK